MAQEQMANMTPEQMAAMQRQVSYPPRCVPSKCVRDSSCARGGSTGTMRVVLRATHAVRCSHSENCTAFCSHVRALAFFLVWTCIFCGCCLRLRRASLKNLLLSRHETTRLKVDSHSMWADGDHGPCYVASADGSGASHDGKHVARSDEGPICKCKFKFSRGGQYGYWR